MKKRQTFNKNMHNSKITCEIGLNKNIIKKGVFEREINLCKMLARKHGGKCGWGECKDCGIVPLLIKLRKGKLLEKPAEIKRTKSKVLKI